MTRDWYLVADLDASAADIRRRTAEFVHACARARAASLGLSSPEVPVIVIGADEKGGSFFKKPVAAKSEQEVRRIQGEVWLALRGRLEAAGVFMTKPRHAAGYEVDGVIHAKGGRILLEIKTGTAAADVYEGVGQLMIYARLLGLEDHRPVLLLPSRAPAPLLQAAANCGIDVHHYDDLSNADGVDIRFPPAFLQRCGVAG